MLLSYENWSWEGRVIKRRWSVRTGSSRVFGTGPLASSCTFINPCCLLMPDEASSRRISQGCVYPYISMRTGKRWGYSKTVGYTTSAIPVPLVCDHRGSSGSILCRLGLISSVGNTSLRMKRTGNTQVSTVLVWVISESMLSILLEKDQSTSA